MILTSLQNGLAAGAYVVGLLLALSLSLGVIGLITYLLIYAFSEGEGEEVRETSSVTPRGGATPSPTGEGFLKMDETDGADAAPQPGRHVAAAHISPTAPIGARRR